MGCPLEDGLQRFGVGQAVRGKCEVGLTGSSSLISTNDQRPIVWEAVSNPEIPPVYRAVEGVQSARCHLVAERDRHLLPAQLVDRPQSVLNVTSIPIYALAHAPQTSCDLRPNGQNRDPYTKASIKIASLNIRGYKNSGGRSFKWNYMNQLIHDKKIRILAIQEAHLDEEWRAATEKLFKKRLRIFVLSNPNNPKGKSGVAFVINKNLVSASGANFEEVVQGRAVLL